MGYEWRHTCSHALALISIRSIHQPHSAALGGGGLIQLGQQGPLDPERGVRVSSWAAILALRAWRASLLSPELDVLGCPTQGGSGAVVPHAVLGGPHPQSFSLGLVLTHS